LFESAEAALEAFESGHPDLVVSDVVLPGITGIELVKRLLGGQNHLPIILTTAFGSTKVAIEATQAGAYDFLEKPFQLSELIQLIRKALRSFDLVRNRIDLNPEEPTDGVALIGKSEAMNIICKQIGRIASTPAPVLIQGETGTGKELIAQAIHQNSERSRQAFVPVHCAALAANLLESEFFGHEKGAFTGATSRRQGRFELADQGTLLLDEISEIPPDLQVKMLRVLQEREFERVGGNQTIQVDVNIIATTNRQLEEEVRAGRFREDLFYRLNVVPLQLPPLRDRGRDVIELASQFAKSFARKHGKPFQPLNGEIEAHLLSYRWPGNVRELQNAVERAVILADNDGILRPEDIVDFGQGLEETEEETADIRPLAELEKRAIIRALDRCEGNRTHAAKLLGISLRTLRNKINRYREDGMDL